jgi:hypothetical protein
VASAPRDALDSAHARLQRTARPHPATVSPPSARLLIADQVASEDAVKAALHNEIERLCDPTHARAPAESELQGMFAGLGLSVIFCGRATIDYSVAEWMSHGGPPPEAAREIERKMRASIDGDRAGLAVRIEDGELRFSHAAVAFVLQTAGG